MTQPIIQSGGSRIGEETKTMICYFILLFLTLLIVYIPRVPDVWLERMRNPLWQFFSIVILFGITGLYGWIHGVLGALAFALLLSRAHMANTRNTNQRNTEYFDDYIVDTNLGKKTKHWFSEKVMGENPYLIRENSITTTAVQDLSERNMGSGYGSPSSK
jgi:hypothetical protein